MGNPQPRDVDAAAAARRNLEGSVPDRDMAIAYAILAVHEDLQELITLLRTEITSDIGE